MVLGALGDWSRIEWLLDGALCAVGLLITRSLEPNIVHRGTSPFLLLLPAMLLLPADEVLAPSSAIEIGIRSDPDTAVSLERG